MTGGKIRKEKNVFCLVFTFKFSGMLSKVQTTKKNNTGIHRLWCSFLSPRKYAYMRLREIVIRACLEAQPSHE